MDIKGLRGGVHRHAAQVTTQIDTVRAAKAGFRMNTGKNYNCSWHSNLQIISETGFYKYLEE
jgi:hypothetical protein